MIKVLHPGFYSSLQDKGRKGFQGYGVPVSGAMDQFSAELANRILGNDPKEAVIEITMMGPKLLFESSVSISVSGALFVPLINNIPAKLNKPLELKAGDVLSFKRPSKGIRGYIGIAGGIDSPYIMGSRSMYSGITEENRLHKDDWIIVGNTVSRKSIVHFKADMDHKFSQMELEAYEGPEFDQLNQKQKEQLFSTEFKISNNNNRMAYQLEEKLINKLSPILTSLVLPGTIQLTPSGTLIILMRDCQTTGGYPRILQLSEQAISILAQKVTGNSIRFKAKQ